MICKHSMIIEWSDEDGLFVVSLPEFGPYASTHGKTHEKAARMGRECPESLIEAYQADGQALPEVAKYGKAISE